MASRLCLMYVLKIKMYGLKFTMFTKFTPWHPRTMCWPCATAWSDGFQMGGMNHDLEETLADKPRLADLLVVTAVGKFGKTLANDEFCQNDDLAKSGKTATVGSYRLACNKLPYTVGYICSNHQHLWIEVHNVHQVHALVSKDDVLAVRVVSLD